LIEKNAVENWDPDVSLQLKDAHQSKHMHVQLHNHICQLEDVFEHIGTWYDNMSLYMYIYCFIMFYHQYHGSSGGAKQVALQTRGGLRQAGSLPFSCYYWTLILVAAASAEHGSKWSHFFADSNGSQYLVTSFAQHPFHCFLGLVASVLSRLPGGCLS